MFFNRLKQTVWTFILQNLQVMLGKSDFFFNQYIKTLKETSRDGDDFMTESSYPVVAFDDFKKNYSSNRYCDLRSNDALLRPLDNNGKFVFVEFKNGRINDISNMTEIVEKIYESLLVFNEVKKENFSFDKSRVVYILVYNEEKNSQFANNSHSAKKAGEKYIIPQLDRYKKLFADFFTMTKSEFLCITTKLDAGEYPF